MTIKKLLFFLVSLLFGATVYAQTYTPLPYYCGFETQTDETEWICKARPQKTPFVIGSATRRNGTRSLYLSHDGGKTADYESTGTGYVSVAYRQFTLQKGDYDLIFDLRASGGYEKDSLMVACFSTIGPNGTARTPSTASSGISFPTEALQNPFVDNKNRKTFGTIAWSSIVGSIKIAADGDYWLAFYFKESGKAGTSYKPGVIIDNVQFNSKKGPLDCASMPTDLRVTKTATSVDISWKGNASTYDLEYFSAHSKNSTAVTTIKGINARNYSIPLIDFPEGNYTFSVRATCPTDTSLWVTVDNMLVYDPSQHCIDYLDIASPDVVCTTGNFKDPFMNKGIVDDGPSSKYSFHTTHTDGDEYDPRTGYALKTVPDGSVASIRLGGWQENQGVPSGSITYKYKVDPDNELLLVKYAAVLQYEDTHKAHEQTRILVEILDSRDKLLSSCTKSEFNALNVKNDNLRNWHNFDPVHGETEQGNPIKYSDWCTLGLDLRPYVGQDVKIRLTIQSCYFDWHFAYCYFAIDCSKGDIEGMSCGEIPNQFEVSEGFDYKWYRQNDSSETSVCDKNVFVPEPGDTCSYYVDVMNPEDHNCKFRLSAYTMPIMPRSKADFVHRPEGCVNRIEIIDQSGVYKLPSGKPEERTDEKITSYRWNLGNYGESTEANPAPIIVPNEGDTFKVVLTTTYNGCDDTKEFTVKVPAIGTLYDTISAYFCDGQYIEVNGVRYDKAGEYEQTLKSSFSGCDSVLTIKVDVLVAETISYGDTICSGQEYDFYGEKLTETGRYYHHVASTMGCDTLIYQLDLLVFPTLTLHFIENDAICADGDSVMILFALEFGTMSEANITFDDAAHKAGFQDYEKVTCQNDYFTIPMPEGIAPGVYHANVLFLNADCGNIELPLTLEVKYPATIITQRWNDVLGVMNADHNGGYDFVGFQWYEGNSPITGAIVANYYTEGGMLNFGSTYSVLLTRTDGVSVMTCPFAPTQFAEGDVTEISTVTFAGTPITASMPEQAVANIFSSSGIKLSSQRLNIGDNEIAMPTLPGIYLLHITYQNGTSQIHKIVVR